MAGLKQCPFCGGRAGIIHTESNKPWAHEEYWTAWCSVCLVHTKYYPTAAEAGEAWNKRFEGEKHNEPVEKNAEKENKAIG